MYIYTHKHPKCHDTSIYTHEALTGGVNPLTAMRNTMENNLQLSPSCTTGDLEVGCCDSVCV